MIVFMNTWCSYTSTNLFSQSSAKFWLRYLIVLGSNSLVMRIPTDHISCQNLNWRGGGEATGNIETFFNTVHMPLVIWFNLQGVGEWEGSWLSRSMHEPYDYVLNFLHRKIPQKYTSPPTPGKLENKSLPTPHPPPTPTFSGSAHMVVSQRLAGLSPILITCVLYTQVLFLHYKIIAC